MAFHARPLVLLLGAALGGCATAPDEVPDGTDDSDASVPDDPPGGGSVSTDAPQDFGPGRCVFVNAAGTVVGIGDDDVPFLMAPDGDRTPLGLYDGRMTFGLVVDAQGVVSGYSDSLEGRVPLEHRDGAWQEVPGLGDGAAVLATTPAGVRAGLRNDAGGLRGFVLEAGGTERTLDLPADMASAVYGITADRYVGIVEAAGLATHAFVAEGGEIVDLGTLGGKNSTALSVNASGVVVGASERSDGAVHAFVRRAGADVIEDLGRDPDALGSDARGVDDAGRIVLNHQFEDGTTRPEVILPGGTAVDLRPVAAGVPYVSAQVAAVSPSGTAVGWGVPKAGGDHPLRCLVWDLDTVRGP